LTNSSNDFYSNDEHSLDSNQMQYEQNIYMRKACETRDSKQMIPTEPQLTLTPPLKLDCSNPSWEEGGWATLGTT
jgi:hypothetical protein